MQIMPKYSVIIWHNLMFLLTLRQNINAVIWKIQL